LPPTSLTGSGYKYVTGARNRKRFQRVALAPPPLSRAEWRRGVGGVGALAHRRRVVLCPWEST
jgi:hypothetical protein